jgi:hypothetical protein
VRLAGAPGVPTGWKRSIERAASDRAPTAADRPGRWDVHTNVRESFDVA